MESNLHDISPPAAEGSQQLLNDLAADRTQLARHIEAPRWLYPVAGLLAAIFIASASIDGDMTRRVVAGLALASIFLLVWGFQRATGVKLSRAGRPAQLILFTHVLALLLLLSVSFGLASLDLHWWIILPALIGFALTVALGKRFHRQYSDEVRHGR